MTLPSEHGWDETRKRLDARLARIGIQVFARIDHGANAKAEGMRTRLQIDGEDRIFRAASNAVAALSRAVGRDGSGRATTTAQFEGGTAYI